MRGIVACLTASLLAAPLSANAKDDPVVSLAKVTKWEMKYNPDSCQLVARFGTDNDTVIFVLTREEPGDSFDLELYGKVFEFRGMIMPIELTFGLDGKPTQRSGVSLTSSGTEKLPVVRLTWLWIDGWNNWKHPESMPIITPARETAVTAISFKPPGGKRYRLETGSMGPPLAAMRKCTSDLIQTWGYDLAVEAALTRRATPAASPATWLHSNDFPDKSLIQGHNGLVRFRLDIDAVGQPTGCRILYRTNPDEFADLSCQLLLKRARFRPALNAAGKPVKSYYINNIRWNAGGW